MRNSREKLLLTITVLAFTLNGHAQQFIGLNTTQYSAVQQIPYNPAWVNNSRNGLEISIFSANALAGTNAYEFKKSFIYNGFNGKAIENKDYYRDPQKYLKHMWANIDITGPAISFTYKKEHHIGVYTRMRQIYRGGHISSSSLALLGQQTPGYFQDHPAKFSKAGFSTQTFAEVGITYGKVFRDDYYNILKGGITLKYVSGFVAGSVYTESLEFIQKNDDTIGAIKGDLTALYTHNIGPYIDNNAQNDFSSWFNKAGRWGFGLDIGVQYEYHPNGTPNEPTPYLFSIAASLTDIGGIGYVADTGSGSYDLHITNVDTSQVRKWDFEGLNWYMVRMAQDTILNGGEKAQKFRMGLPTAFRLNADYNVSSKMNIAVNMLLNLRGNGRNVYRPAYVSYFNMTPSYGTNKFKIGVPFTVLGYQTLAIGANAQIGPFYIGSTSLFTTLIANRIRNIDAYIGLAFKFRKNEMHYY